MGSKVVYRAIVVLLVQALLVSLVLGAAIQSVAADNMPLRRTSFDNYLSPRQAVCSPSFNADDFYPVAGTLIASGDFRGAGVLDLVVVDGVTATLFSNDGNGHFTQGAIFASPQPITGLDTGNFVSGSSPQIVINQSGSIVILTVANDGTITAQNLTVAMFIQSNDTVQYSNSNQEFLYFTVGDLNNDGFDDIVGSAVSTQADPLATAGFYYLNNGGLPGNTTFSLPLGLGAVVTIQQFYGVGVGDLLGNGYPDVVFLNSRSVLDFRYISGGYVEALLPGAGLNHIAFPSFPFAGGSGHGADIAISTYYSQVQIYPNLQQSYGLTYPPPVGPSDMMGQIVTTDFNNDGFDDLAVATNYGIIIFLSDSGVFDTIGQLYPLENLTGDSTQLQGVAVGDFNGDGNPDFAVVRDQDPVSGLQIFLNDCPAYTPSTTSTISSTISSSSGCPTLLASTMTITVTAPAVTITAPGVTFTSQAATITVPGSYTTITAPAVTDPGTTLTDIITTTTSEPETTVTDIITTTTSEPGSIVTDLSTVVDPGTTVTSPGTTVTVQGTTITDISTLVNPGTIVTRPGTTITVPGTTITSVVKTITEPGTIFTAPAITKTLRAVTSTITATVFKQTRTVTVTATVTKDRTCHCFKD
jgi:hypothetical protein